MKIVLAMIPAMLLAACGGDAPANNATEAATGVTDAAPPELGQDPNNSMVPLSNDALPAPTPVAAIPAAFRGRWALVPNDCDPARADNKGLMTVAADRIAFYESRAVPRGIAVAGDTLTATLSFSGEGQEWTEESRFTLLGDGRTLTREVTKGDANGTPLLQYSRCPAAAGSPA